jgi:hypothetical protein
VRHLYIATAAMILALISAAPAPAQEQPAPKVIKVEPYLVEKFVKYTIIAVDQANQTGNYTVLHALGSPAFKKTPPADLFKSFEGMRKNNLDLSSVLLYKPRLSSKPELVNGVLRATGYFPTEPLKVNFDIVWVVSRGHLLLHGLVIKPSKDVAQAAPTSDTKVDKPDSN